MGWGEASGEGMPQYFQYELMKNAPSLGGHLPSYFIYLFTFFFVCLRFFVLFSLFVCLFCFFEVYFFVFFFVELHKNWSPSAMRHYSLALIRVSRRVKEPYLRDANVFWNLCIMGEFECTSIRKSHPDRRILR